MKALKIFGVAVDGAVKPLEGELERYKGFLSKVQGAISVTYEMLPDNEEEAIEAYYDYIVYKVYELNKHLGFDLLSSKALCDSLQDKKQVTDISGTRQFFMVWTLCSGYQKDTYFTNVYMYLVKNNCKVLSYKEWKEKKEKIGW